MRLIFAVICLCLLPLTTWAQLTYQTDPNDIQSTPAIISKQDPIKVIVKKTRGDEVSVRADWYGLFLLWAKAHPSETLSGLRDPGSFDNFAAFMACDWVRDFRANDITWPQKQIEIVQKFNGRVLNPPGRFRLLTYAVLGPYIAGQQQFVFKPLEGAAFNIKFPDDKIFGMEDDCTTPNDHKTAPQYPWPREFLLGFMNADFVTTLPMESVKAEYFLNNLPKSDKGEPDRRLVVEIEFDVTNFFPSPADKIASNEKLLPPVHVGITARRAIIYADANRTKELERVGF